MSQVVNNPTATTSTTALSSSANPSVAGVSVTFTATVSGTSPTGTVNFKDGAASITGCAAVALTGSGNTRSAQCSTTTLSQGTHSIVANYSGDASNTASASSALSQVVNSGGGSVNVALAANGGVASASTTYVAPGYAFPVAAVNNGDRAGLNWGNGGGWNDATVFVFDLGVADEDLIARTTLERREIRSLHFADEEQWEQRVAPYNQRMLAFLAAHTGPTAYLEDGLPAL